MFAVCVHFDVKPERLAEFLPLMHTQANNSVTLETGCLRFDVLTDPSRPNSVFLYELYASEEAFDAHMETPHFKSFDAAVSDMLLDKRVNTYAEVAPGG